jgi:hypothetical protein
VNVKLIPPLGKNKYRFSKHFTRMHQEGGEEADHVEDGKTSCDLNLAVRIVYYNDSYVHLRVDTLLLIANNFWKQIANMKLNNSLFY